MCQHPPIVPCAIFFSFSFFSWTQQKTRGGPKWQEAKEGWQGGSRCEALGKSQCSLGMSKLISPCVAAEVCLRLLDPKYWEWALIMLPNNRSRRKLASLPKLPVRVLGRSFQHKLYLRMVKFVRFLRKADFPAGKSALFFCLKGHDVQEQQGEEIE